jgi:hypothetical protein
MTVYLYFDYAGNSHLWAFNVAPTIVGSNRGRVPITLIDPP